VALGGDKQIAMHLSDSSGSMTPHVCILHAQSATPDVANEEQNHNHHLSPDGRDETKPNMHYHLRL
jgi:hypothetical protein